MNAHIELVKKWLANPESVSQQELEDNAISAANDAADYANTASDLYAAAYAADYANAAAADDAVYWVKRYEELSK
jgi:hypothetical protein